MVIPNFWLMSCKSSSMEDVVWGSRALVASSQSKICGSEARLWRLPLFVSVHRRAVRDSFRSVCQSYDFQKLQGFCSCFGFFLPLNVQWEADVFQYVFLHEQVKMLENHSHFSLALLAVWFFWGKFAEGFSVY